MSGNLVREELCNGVFLNTITDDKFKSNLISCNLVLPLAEDTATERAVLPFILRKRSRACPDFTRLNERLCELYGAALDADVRKHGGYQILNISIRSLDDRYTIGGEPVAAACAQLVCDLLLDPYLVDGVFDAQDFALEQQFLIDTIESEINEKRDYAISRCRSLMFKGEPFAVKKYGDKAHAERLTPAIAAAAYREAVRDAAVEILFIGCGDPAGAKKIFTERFSQLERTPIDYKVLPTKPCADQITEQTDRMDVNQGKLVMGFRVGELPDLETATASQLMCVLYGGTPFSRLFTHVREEHSLCYYCASRFDKATGSLLVDSGVEAANKEQAQQEILKQMDVLREGAFEQSELDDTVLALVNALKSATDSLGGMENWYLSQILACTNQTPMENAALVSGITKEQVMQAARKVTLDTVYFLTGKEDGSHE